ncbi:MAG TPA: type II toxin-antitoxin system ParD family antitoxin [Longimicrobiales bacterium]
MNVSLTPELERAISELVESGRYRSASEVVRAAVRLLLEREEEREVKLAALRKAVDEGVEALDRGEGVDGPQVFEEILAALRRDEAA